MGLVTGVALVVTVWSSHRSIHRASEAVVWSEGERLLDAVRGQLRRSKGRPTTARLEAILEDRRAAGLRYVGIHGREKMGAGRLEGRVALAPPRPGSPRIKLLHLERRVQMIEYPTPPPPHHETLQLHPPPKGKAPPHWVFLPPPGPVLVIEYEPLLARQVRAEANRTLLIGFVAALALLLLTGFFWRALRQREVADARRQRERRLAALGEMAAVLAHEIRNPLTSLKGHAQLLVELLSGESSRERDKARRVVQETERLEVIATDLLDFVRTGPLERREVDPAEIVRGVADQLGADRFRLDLDHAPRCSVDPLRLQQVLTNVMQNALQASPPDESVEVALAEERGCLSIRVRDHGAGIAPEDRERIFEPFHTSRARGTGLGLAVSRRLVELHGGDIVVEAAVEGAELHISIPIKQRGSSDDTGT